ncbi:MAG: transcriptional regulator, partial [Mesorhizobium sp.]
MRALQSLAFAFGDFLLIPEERLLLRGGEPVALTAKAFDLLVVLVRRAGHLVTKDELFDEVWPGTFVQETNLTVNISALRKALDDGRDGSRIIQTVPGRGYRFVAPVVV